MVWRGVSVGGGLVEDGGDGEVEESFGGEVAWDPGYVVEGGDCVGEDVEVGG